MGKKNIVSLSLIDLLPEDYAKVQIRKEELNVIKRSVLNAAYLDAKSFMEEVNKLKKKDIERKEALPL